MKKTLAVLLPLIVLAVLVYLFVFTNAQILDNRLAYSIIFLSSFLLMLIFYKKKHIK